MNIQRKRFIKVLSEHVKLGFMIELFVLYLQNAAIMALRLVMEYIQVASCPPRQSCVRQCLQPREDLQMPTSCDMRLSRWTRLQALK